MARRMSRGSFWKWAIISLVVTYFASTVLMRLALTAGGLKSFAMMQPIMMLWAIPFAILGTWRLHDIGRSGWPAWLPLAFSAAGPFILAALPMLMSLAFMGTKPDASAYFIYFGLMTGIGLVLLGVYGWLIYLWCQPGDEMKNRYGAPAA